MSGKGAGKKRNRAAQSEQHGFQEHPSDVAAKLGSGKGGKNHSDQGTKQRIIDKLRDLEKRRQDKEKTAEDQAER